MHGRWCRTRTWPTECSTCSASVYFFSCDCGSKVFFEELGPPWPQHDCRKGGRSAVARTVDAEGVVTTAHFAHGVTVIELSPSFGIEPGRLPLPRRRQVRPDPIEAMLPCRGAEEEVIGVVREVRHKVDVFQSLRVPDTSVARAMLGPIGRQVVGRLTVHAPSPEEPDLLESFTAWAPEAMLDDLRRGLTVLVDLQAVQLPSQECAWFCRSLALL